MTSSTVPEVEAEQFLGNLESLVAVESPTESADACSRALDVLEELIAVHWGRPSRRISADGRPHLLVPASGQPRVLLLGHIDTVWPMGTLARWPMAVDGDVVTGPGTFDMKAGLVMALLALASCPGSDDVAMLVTTDEEVGSPTSEAVIKDVAADAAAVLVPEPSGPGGAVKAARKGVGMFTAHVTGRAAHAGLEPERGVNALLELAALAPQIAAIGDPEAGTTVSPTTAAAGTTRNTIPAEAWCRIDVRASTVAEMERVRREIDALGPTLDGAEVRIEEEGWRPPLERSMSAALLERHSACRAALGLPMVEPMMVGGGSDGNFTAAMGIPTLDGIGAVGGGAHAEGEHIRLGATLDATRVLAALLEDLTADQGG